MKKFIHVLKAVSSAILPGSGQALNKQYLKAAFFFVFFAAFVLIEVTSSRYFTNFDPYSKLVSVTGELYSDQFASQLHSMYTFQKLENEVQPIPEYEAYYAVHANDADGWTMKDVIRFVAQDIENASTARYFVLDTDVVLRNNAYHTSNTGLIRPTDLLIGEDDAEIASQNFIQVVFGVNIYEKDGREYYRVIEGEGPTRREYFVNVNDPNDQINDITGLFLSRRTEQLYYDRIHEKVYVRSTISGSVLGSTSYRYTNVVDSSDWYDASQTAPQADKDAIAAMRPLNVKGYLMYSGNTKELFVRYIPEANYRFVNGYNATPFSTYLKNYLTKIYNGNTSYTARNYNRLLLEVYLTIHDDLRIDFENEYYNFYYDQGGFFLKGIWSIITLGTTEKVTYRFRVLHDALKSTAFTEDGISYLAVDGIVDEIPLLGHPSAYLLINGLISTLLLAYFFFVHIWSVTDAYKTSLLQKEQNIRVRDRDWFKDVYTHGFEYIMILPALFVITFISIMPILFGFMIAFTSYSGYDSDTGLFTWVAFRNFAAIFSFGEGIPFGEMFWKVFSWTVIWAIFSTVTVFFGGMFQAVVISSERVPFKKFWRTLLILPWAVPALISQMAFSIIFSERGVVNAIFRDAGLYTIFQRWGILGVDFSESMTWIQKMFYLGRDNIQWFNNANNVWFVRIALILVNIWLGAPYFMALMTSIMTSIDKTLYEAADIDGASKGQKFRFITFPLVMFSTAPILVMTFSGNFNNFGVIYFITQGGFGAGDIATAFAGSTDILISWMYTLTVRMKVYNMASVFSILIFVIVGSIAAWNFSQTRAFKED